MKRYLPLIALLTLVSTPFIPTPVIAEETQLVASEIESEIKEYARSISVKVTTDNQNKGSGVIIGKQGNKYLVITNNHVIRDGKTFSLQTADGTKHQASIVPNPIISDDDIVLLSFNSSNEYEVVKLNSANTGKEEKQIYAVGYSAETGEFLVESGNIERIPDRPFKEGYQIGYSSDIVSGMSGGAIFDDFGDLVGINGIGAFPILNTPYQYEDETTPTAAEIEQFRSLSWGLSVHRLLTQLNQEIITAYSLPLPKTAAEVPQTELTGWLGDLEAKAKQITVRIDSSSGANGSGVIIAKEDNTYTVLTADHVLCEKDEDTNECIEHTYEIITPDGEQYPLDANTINAQPGVDLAVFKFVSNKTYQVAELADYPVQDVYVTFVAGYPLLGDKPQWQFSLGYGLEKEGVLHSVKNTNNSSIDSFGSTASQSNLVDDYEMVYTSPTYRGMSGGAVLDKEGRVIGIHGLAEVETSFDSQGGLSQEKTIQLGYSLGIPIKTFVELAEDTLGISQKLPIQAKLPQTLDSDEKNTLKEALLETEISDNNTTAEGWLERGNYLWRLIRYDEAERAFDQAIAQKPKFIHLAYYGKGLALAYQDKHEEALASLEQATIAQPSFALAFLHTSVLLEKLNRLDEALIAIDKAIRINSQNANWHSLKGNILSDLKRYIEAEASYSKAIELNVYSSFYNNRALIYDEQGKIDLALADYNQAIKINPRSTYAYNNRGNFYREQGKMDLALADYNQVIQLKPKKVNTYLERAILYKEQGKIDLALADYNQAIKIDIQNVYAYNHRGYFYAEQGKIDLALADYNQAIEINPQYADAYYSRGNLYAEQGRIDLAFADYNQAIEINPQYADAHYSRGNLYAEQGKIDLAFADYNQAIEINPQYDAVYINRGIMYAEQGKVNLAFSDFKQAIKINPQDAEAYFNLGALHRDQRKIDLALSYFNQSIKLDPQNAESYYNRGYLYSEKREVELALADYNQALKLNPKHAQVYTNRGALHNNQGKLGLALADYNQALKLNPKLPEAYYYRGNTYKNKGKINLAFADYNQALKLNYQYTDVYYSRGVLYYNQGELDLALADYNQALKLNPQQSESFYIIRGVLYRDKREINLALADLQQAVKINPQSANAHSLLGVLYKELGNKKAAIANLQKAQQLFIAQKDTNGAEHTANVLKTLE